MKTRFFKIEAKGAGAAEIFLYDEIGAFGITAKKFRDDLAAVGPVKNLTVFINSPGGEVFDGFAIYNMLVRHPASKTIRIDGLAASIASVIAMAGDKIVMAENSFLLVHRSSGVVIGTGEDMKDFSETMEKFDDSIARAYEKKTGKTHEDILQLMAEETWLSAAEAVEAGFADEVAPAMQVAAFFDLSRFTKAPAALSKPAETPTAPTPAPQPTAVEPDEIRAQVRMEEAARVAQIFDLCAAAGVAHVASVLIGNGLSGDEAREQLADAEFIKAQKSIAISGEVREIVALCTTAGVPDLAETFIAKGMTIAEVRDRLKDAGPIRDACAAAFSRNPKAAKERGDKYIRAGMSIAEVRPHLQDVLIALSGPEIDNKLGPDAGFQTQKSLFDPAAIAARYGRNHFLNTAEVYANWRNPKRGSFADLAAPLIAALKNLDGGRY